MNYPIIRSFFLIILVSLTFHTFAWGAACCGGRSAALPMLIVGDDEAQFTVGFAAAKVLADPSAEGVPTYVAPNESDLSKTVRFDGALMVSDRVQLAVGGSFVNHTVETSNTNQASFGSGDLRLSGGYEYLTAWSYSDWKPQGFLFSTLSLPVGKSIYEASQASDITGTGFYSLSVGSLFIKRWTEWDLFAIIEGHYSLPRSFDYSWGSIEVYPGFGGSAGLGGGYSPDGGFLRIGARVQPRIDQAQAVPSMDQFKSSRGVMSQCDVGFDLSIMVNPRDSIFFNYTDQTLLGPAQNTNLNRIFAFSLQHRWAR